MVLGRWTVIVERQDAEGWGNFVVSRSADDSRAECSGMAGLSASNLWADEGVFRSVSRLGETRPNGARNAGCTLSTPHC